jgi:hypothetical protein
MPGPMISVGREMEASISFHGPRFSSFISTKAMPIPGKDTLRERCRWPRCSGLSLQVSGGVQFRPDSGLGFDRAAVKADVGERSPGANFATGGAHLGAAFTFVGRAAALLGPLIVGAGRVLEGPVPARRVSVTGAVPTGPALPSRPSDMRCRRFPLPCFPELAVGETQFRARANQ